MAFGGGLNSSSGGELKLYLCCTGSTKIQFLLHLSTRCKREPVYQTCCKREPVYQTCCKQEPVYQTCCKREPVYQTCCKREPVYQTCCKREPMYQTCCKREPMYQTCCRRDPVYQVFTESLSPTILTQYHASILFQHYGLFPLTESDSDSDSGLRFQTLWLHSIMQNMFPLTQIQIRIPFT